LPARWPRTRLVTLTGPGGCGKTRLALQVAACQADAFADGVWFADLTPCSDDEQVASAIAAEVGAEDLEAQLRDRHVLLVLDNCEQAVGPVASLVDALLRACPRLSVLATSREPLRVEGEMAWRVPPLSLPAENEPVAIEALTQYDAVKLFVDRALRARPNFAVTADNAPAIAEICHRLDGIPLALELAAALVRMLAVEQILDGLHDRFRLLTGGARTAVPRQQALLASVDWSHELLTDAERTVFRRLAVWPGRFTLDGAEAVAAGDGVDRLAVLQLLMSLADRSLVVLDEVGPPARYRLLETIRQYALDRLRESGGTTRLRRVNATSPTCFRRRTRVFFHPARPLR
jgi:predicted ATPase